MQHQEWGESNSPRAGGLLSRWTVPGSGAQIRGSYECEFNAEDFEKIAALIYRQAGIVLRSGKEPLAYTRLLARLRVHGMRRFSDYLALLRQPNATELQEFTNALTTNLTQFFREPHHFPILARHIVKEQFTHAHRMVWCTACSTGEEAYSIAIALAEAFDSLNPPVKVLATDIDTNVLAQARRGIYSLARLGDLSAQQRARFFQIDRLTQRARVRPELRNLVVFRHNNLLNPTWPMRPPIDAIFCRNVLIYFDRAAQQQTVRRFAPLMHPEGLLFAGHAENYAHSRDLFEPLGSTVYCLTEQGKSRARQGLPHWRPA